MLVLWSWNTKCKIKFVLCQVPDLSMFFLIHLSGNSVGKNEIRKYSKAFHIPKKYQTFEVLLKFDNFYLNK